MANKAVKEYDDFTGTNGYLIVDGLTDNESGGKMKVPNYSGVTDGYVLTKTTTNGSDDVVWSAPAGGTSLPDTPSDYTSKSYVLGFNKSTGELAWQQISNGSGGVLPYVI
jgi:hypothetical protein